VSVSSSFLWRFLEDVWDLLPTEDRSLFEQYWSAQVQIASSLEQKTIEAALSTQVSSVPVFLTERWLRFVMDEDACDLFTKTDTIAISGLASFALSKETAFYDTLVVSNTSGQIQHSETMRFFDDAVRGLRYGKLITGTVSVTLGGFEYVQNLDYAVNLASGTIQVLDDGRIPPTELVTIRYQHSEYTLGLDYEVVALDATINRTAGSSIPDMSNIAASYTYNGTATLPMAGTAGAVDLATLTDLEQDFSTLIPNRTLTVPSGPNAGTYTINSVLGTNQVLINESFPVVQETGVEYSINAFPHGIKVSSAIASIPSLQEKVDNPETFLVEGADYRVSGGFLSVRTAFPLSDLGPEDLRERQVWATTTKVDRETPYRNFGVLIDFYRTNSEAYKLALQGLWYTFWTGSTPGNLQRGLHILLGLPFAKFAGTISRVDADLGEIDITEARGRVITYQIPDGLTAVVARDDEVSRFDSLTTGVSIVDRNSQPGFVASELGRSGVQRFLTSNASLGLGNTDETKALDLLEYHLFLPRVLVEAVAQRINVNELVTFLDNMKPARTTYVFSFLSDESETLTFSEETPANDLQIDLTSTVSNNTWNQALQFNLHRIQDGVSAHTGTLQAIAGADLVDGETFELDDGANSPVTFEFDSNASVVETSTLRRVAFTAGDSAQTVSDAMVAAVSGAPTLDWTPTNAGGTVTLVTVTHSLGFTYNTTIHEAVANASFVVAQPTTPLVGVRLFTGAILAGGTQATGNFQASGIDFADLGVDRGDIVFLPGGPLPGHHEVIKRVSSSVLSLDIPDASIVGASSLEFIVMPFERRMDNDAINIRNENLIFAGTDFPAPASLNTKTDIDFGVTDLRNEDVKALMLLDIGNTGKEVQTITDADIDLDEISVGTSPGVVTRDHEIAAAALKRTNNVGSIVTDVFAI